MPTPIEFEVPPPAVERRWVALATSAVLHLVIVLLLIFGVPSSNASSLSMKPGNQVAQPLAMAPPSPELKKPEPRPIAPPVPQQIPPPPAPPPPMKEVALGPDSKHPDAPAKEAAAKQSDADAANTAKAKAPEPAPPPAPVEQPKAEPEPPAPQKISIPKPGDYTGAGAIPLPMTSAFGPPKIDSASGSPPPEASPAAAPAGSMGRTGLANRDPQKWENSFDDETSGQCVQIPDLGKNPDGTPVLATVIGNVFDTDGRTPMPGAHLQIMGTQFGTFSDSHGEYVLPFDPKLLQKCRKQYVQVVAPGYRSQLLVLMIGPRVRSDPVVLRH